MTDLRSHTISQEPRGEVYRNLLAACLPYTNLALLVVREFDQQWESHPVLSQLASFTVSGTRESSWPGTELLGGNTAYIIRFKFNQDTARILSESVEGLYDWLTPNMPEDFCLIRPSGEPLLVSIAHERDGYLQVSDAELLGIRSQVPDLKLTSE